MAKVERLPPERYEVALLAWRGNGGPRLVGRCTDPLLVRLVRVKAQYQERLRREHAARFWTRDDVRRAVREVEFDELLSDPLDSDADLEALLAANEDLARELAAAEREAGQDRKPRREGGES